MKYAIEVESNMIEDIKGKFSVVWESDIIDGLLVVEADYINELVGVDGIKRVEENRTGVLYGR